MGSVNSSNSTGVNCSNSATRRFARSTWRVRDSPSARSLTPEQQQTTTISRDATTNPISHNVVSGALVLKFRLLFQDPSPGEGGFVINIPMLQRYAAKIWTVVRD